MDTPPPWRVRGQHGQSVRTMNQSESDYRRNARRNRYRATRRRMAANPQYQARKRREYLRGVAKSYVHNHFYRNYRYYMLTRR